jgi:hypothetical protein
MVYGEHNILDASALHLSQEDFQDGHITNGHERLGEDGGVGGEPGALAPG